MYDSCLSLKQRAGLVAVTVMAAYAGLGWLWPPTGALLPDGAGDNSLFSNAAPLTFAQNGMFRASNDKCDIGAFAGPAELFIPAVLK